MHVGSEDAREKGSPIHPDGHMRVGDALVPGLDGRFVAGAVWTSAFGTAAALARDGVLRDGPLRVNACTGKELSYGDVLASVFNPVGFDAGRIVRAMKAAGMKGLVLVCKHHDGFCLWPSRYTEYSVKNSP